MYTIVRTYITVHVPTLKYSRAYNEGLGSTGG